MRVRMRMRMRMRMMTLNTVNSLATNLFPSNSGWNWNLKMLVLEERAKLKNNEIYASI